MWQKFLVNFGIISNLPVMVELGRAWNLTYSPSN